MRINLKKSVIITFAIPAPLGYRNEDRRDMLLQQGLDDIADSTVSEQVAYLLVERARLMDELEAEQARNVVHTPEGPMTAEQLLVRVITDSLSYAMPNDPVGKVCSTLTRKLI